MCIPRVRLLSEHFEDAIVRHDKAVTNGDVVSSLLDDSFATFAVEGSVPKRTEGGKKVGKAILTGETYSILRYPFSIA